jgi:hypothetical protein
MTILAVVEQASPALLGREMVRSAHLSEGSKGLPARQGKIPAEVSPERASAA